MVCHDDTLTRTAGQDGVIREMTFDEVRRADAGYSFSSGIKLFPFRGQGIQIPTLREVLTAFSYHLFIVELKHGGELVSAQLEIVRETENEPPCADRGASIRNRSSRSERSRRIFRPICRRRRPASS